MPILEQNVKMQIDVTPEEMAALFWAMTSEEHCEFFNYLAENCFPYDFEMQILAVVKNSDLSAEALHLIKIIAGVIDEH